MAKKNISPMLESLLKEYDMNLMGPEDISCPECGKNYSTSCKFSHREGQNAEPVYIPLYYCIDCNSFLIGKEFGGD